ncbi:MAG: hypothetical protein AAFS03_05435 [Pseudomonadota bacterium]
MREIEVVKKRLKVLNLSASARLPIVVWGISRIQQSTLYPKYFVRKRGAFVFSGGSLRQHPTQSKQSDADQQFPGEIRAYENRSLVIAENRQCKFR